MSNITLPTRLVQASCGCNLDWDAQFPPLTDEQAEQGDFNYTDPYKDAEIDCPVHGIVEVVSFNRDEFYL